MKSAAWLEMAVLAVLAAGAPAQSVYHRPPALMRALINAPAPPVASVSPNRRTMLLLQPVRFPDISVLARPMERLAGLRMDPANNGPHAPQRYIHWQLVNLVTGTRHALELPASVYAGAPLWSPDGRRFAFLNYGPRQVELWVGDGSTGAIHRLGGVAVNAALEVPRYGGSGEPGRGPITWMPDSRELLVRLVPAGRGAPPPEPAVVAGPVVQQSLADPAPVPTYEDLLANPHDAALYTYFATAQLALVNVNGGGVRRVGQPGIFSLNAPSPDGRHLLVAREHTPYSYLVPQNEFPRWVEVWNLNGETEYRLADLPLAEHAPINGAPTGPRSFDWEPARPATLVWVEALDRGNPGAQVKYRDAVRALAAPFAGSPVTLARTAGRFAGLQWGSEGDLGILSSRVWRSASLQTDFFDPRHPGAAPRPAWTLNTRSQYANPGRFVETTMPGGMQAVLERGGSVFLTGAGASPTGDHPFLDRLEIASLRKQRLFQSGANEYATVVALLAPDASSLLVERQTPTDPPNYYIYSGGQRQEISAFAEPEAVAAFIASIHYQRVVFHRPDGVQLSMYVYLPPGYRARERDPAVVVGYPLEYSDAHQADQITGSQNMYPAFPVSGASSGDTGGPLYLLADGYVVLDNTTMPIVGPPQTVNDTFVPQLVADCKAAIDQAAAMGFIDPRRVGVTGHSYGAFMTANVMANSDLFAAGVAQSGAYNRTLTPFGFQSERRTFWQAEPVYERLSPFFYADKVKAPMLIINGVDDNNSGTFPIQSLRMYEALEGNGATVRWVQLPYEAHIYIGRQSVEDVVWEMMTWFDRYVKHARHGKSARQ